VPLLDFGNGLAERRPPADDPFVPVRLGLHECGRCGPARSTPGCAAASCGRCAGDVDLREGVIRVARSWADEEGEQADGKTDAATRSVPIVGALMPELRGHQMRSGRRGSDLVFGATAERAFEPSTVRRRALAAWEEAKLEPITLHEGRHTMASLMIAAGVDPTAICEWLGHATIAITYDR
jgi:integrase